MRLPELLRGTRAGLEFVFAAEAGEEAFAQAVERLAEQPEFYRGSQAAAIFAGEPPPEEGFESFLAAVRSHGVELTGLYGGSEIAGFAAAHALEYLGEPRPTLVAMPAARPARAEAAELTERARSLDADFAGARADIARRRAQGESSVRRPDFGTPARVVRTIRTVAPAGPETLYHRGTVRGGKALQQVGNIVVIGDVNPGAELVASGDIVVFGALHGTAHAGAQGDILARVMALALSPTQLRIATFIAADDGKRAREPEVAFVQDERITIAPYARQGARR